MSGKFIGVYFREGNTLEHNIIIFRSIYRNNKKPTSSTALVLTNADKSEHSWKGMYTNL